MTKKDTVIKIVFAGVLFGTCVTLAQEPVQNIDPHRHANLAEAQHLMAQANRSIMTAQKDNRYDMHGHAQKARELLVQASEELKRAAEDANH
jgi:hypothetical protein